MTVFQSIPRDDDLLIHAEDFEDLLKRVQDCIKTLWKKNLSLNPKKSYYGCQSVEYLGHSIDGRRLRHSKSMRGGEEVIGRIFGLGEEKFIFSAGIHIRCE
eukprot:GHVP01056384.1.p1 GENE.GHVP01056384.1~~GHVP01056384.1.p1  ORF type:complete len:109 (+),score=15.06 GHVP01056384.1:25-327(+)